MSKTVLLGSLELTKMNNVFIMEKKSKSGQMVKCLCIPIPHNEIREFPVKDGKGNIIPNESSNRFGIEFRAVLNEEKDQYGRNGFVAMKLPKDLYEKHKDNTDYCNKMQPILGNFIKLDSPNHDIAGPELNEINEEDSDLPF